MATRDLLVYYQRWQALDALIKETYATYAGMADDKTDPVGGLPRKDTILYLLQELQAFASGQFQFFYFGFEPDQPPRNGSEPLLQTWDEYPPEDILTAVVDQIGHDLDLIQQAANQRLPGNQIMRDTLATTDRLAWLALAPASQYKVIDQPTTVLTYFEKAAEFYNIPYARVALIAVPFTATMPDNHQDFLAIPHEVGHYVFRHLSADAKKALEPLPATVVIPDDYRKWFTAIFEELCADIYGCLIGGPVTAVDFANLALANSQSDFRIGDSLHPNPALRPLIYCQVLANQNVRRWTDADWSPLAKLLSKEWDSRLQQRHVTDFIVKATRPDGLMQIVDPQPHIIADDLKPVLPARAKVDHGQLGDAVKTVVDTLMGTLLAILSAKR